MFRSLQHVIVLSFLLSVSGLRVNQASKVRQSPSNTSEKYAYVTMWFEPPQENQLFTAPQSLMQKGSHKTKDGSQRVVHMSHPQVIPQIAMTLEKSGSKYPLVVLTNKASLKSELEHHSNVVVVPINDMDVIQAQCAPKKDDPVNEMSDTFDPTFYDPTNDHKTDWRRSLMKLDFAKAKDEFWQQWAKDHWGNTFQKLSIFGFTNYDKLLWLDTDIFIKRNVDYLFDYDLNQGKTIYTQQNTDWNTCKFKNDNGKICSGVMLFKPHADLSKGLLQTLNRMEECPGDQDVLEAFLKKEGLGKYESKGFPLKTVNWLWSESKSCPQSADMVHAAWM